MIREERIHLKNLILSNINHKKHAIMNYLSTKQYQDIYRLISSSLLRINEIKEELRDIQNNIDAAKYSLDLSQYGTREDALKHKNENVVYEFYCKITDTYYIGSTKNAKYRYNTHIKSTEQDDFHNDLRKYGENNFEYRIIDYCTNREEAYKLERLCINTYKKEGKKLYNKF